MIYFYTGTPGSGKGLHTAEVIYHMLRDGKNVITNIVIHTELIEPKKNKPLGHYIYVPSNGFLRNGFVKYPKEAVSPYSYIQGLYGFAENFHECSRGSSDCFREHQTYLILDECRLFFNSRAWNRSDRSAWVEFFGEHRKYGFDCILISQSDNGIDKQIRDIFQRKVDHRCVTDYKIFGKLLKLILGRQLFLTISSDYKIKKKEDARIGTRYFFGKQKFYDLYNTGQLFKEHGINDKQ